MAGGSQDALAGERVSIEGGVDQTGHLYKWVVTNHDASPIVYVEFPHHRANLFFAPNRWRTDESTNLIAVGVTATSGRCIARVELPTSGIARRRFAEFSMQISPAGAIAGAGTVLIRFADGSEVAVKGVELPQSKPVMERFVPLIVLGSVFAIWLIYKAYNRRKSTVAGGSAAGTP